MLEYVNYWKWSLARNDPQPIMTPKLYLKWSLTWNDLPKSSKWSPTRNVTNWVVTLKPKRFPENFKNGISAGAGCRIKYILKRVATLVVWNEGIHHKLVKLCDRRAIFLWQAFFLTSFICASDGKSCQFVHWKLTVCIISKEKLEKLSTFNRNLSHARP